MALSPPLKIDNKILGTEDCCTRRCSNGVCTIVGLWRNAMGVLVPVQGLQAPNNTPPQMNGKFVDGQATVPSDFLGLLEKV
jgi:hypothetical protein